MKKKVIFGIMAALLALCFLGCPTGTGNIMPNPYGADTPAGWTVGLEDFTVQNGTAPGYVKIKFGGTDPAADSYELYWAGGSKTKAEVLAGDCQVIDPNEADSSGFIEVPIGAPNMYCTFVLVATKGSEQATSAVKYARTQVIPSAPTGGKSMNVSGIPGDVVVDFAYLYSIDASSSSQPVTEAFAYNRGGAFAFEGPGQNLMGDGRAWTGSGEYYITLGIWDADYAAANEGRHPELYIFTNGNDLVSIDEGPAPYDFSDPISTIAFNLFKLLDFPDVPYKLTVSGSIPADIIAAVVFDYFGGNVIAVATDLVGSGIFEFYAPDFTNPAMPMPSDTPWSGGGSYPLVLSTILGEMYLYTEGAGFPQGFGKTFDFSGNTGSASWSDFEAIPQEPEPFVLTVSNIPGTITIDYAELYATDGGPAVATATNVNGDFEFDPWPGDGVYYLTLFADDTTEYTYTKGTSGDGSAATFTFSGDTETIDWDQFEEI